MNEFFQQFLDTIVTYVPGALAALGILIGGWILAFRLGCGLALSGTST